MAQLNNVGAPLEVKTGFNRVHQEAIAALVDDASRSIAESIQGVNRSANLLLGKATREQLTQKIATGQISGAALKDVRLAIKGVLAEQGLSSIVDKSGRTWTLDRYADTLFRTKAVEGRNRGLINRMVENDFDLVQVSDHGPASCALCAPWQGKILSISGSTRGYQRVSEAERAGLFHPNCRHALNAVVPKLARLTRAYDPNTKTLSPAGSTLRKPIEENALKSIVKPAEKYQKEFEANVKAIAAAGNWVSKVGPVKDIVRTADKIIDDYNGVIFDLKDANRATVIVKNPFDKEEFARVQNAVAKHYKIDPAKVKEKNNLASNDGYAAAYINPELPGGRKVEIQVTYKEMLTAKNELGGHKLYEVYRARKPGWREAKKEMDKLYADAFKLASDRTGMGNP